MVEGLTKASKDPNIVDMVIAGRFGAQSSSDYLNLSKLIEKFKAAGEKDQLLRLHYVQRAVALKQLTKARPNIKNPNLAREAGFIDEVEYSDLL